MMDAKALLDSLMGPARDKPKDQQRTDGWKDRDVCKRFLVGFCPNNAHDNWFHNTRRDVGVCNLIHSERLRADFEGHPDRKKYQSDFEMDFLRYLEAMNAEADAWITRERGHCAKASKVPKLSEDQKAVVADMQEEADKAMKQAEEYAEEGKITASKQAAEVSKKLIEDIASLKETNSYIPRGDEVCEICGVRTQLPPERVGTGASTDDMSNYTAHQNSNLHKAYTKIRAKAKELRDKMRHPEKPEENADEAGSTVAARDDKDKDKDAPPSRKRGDRDRRSRDRGRGDRDRDRDRDRGRDRDRSRSRDRRRR